MAPLVGSCFSCLVLSDRLARGRRAEHRVFVSRYSLQELHKLSMVFGSAELMDWGVEQVRPRNEGIRSSRSAAAEEVGHWAELLTLISGDRGASHSFSPSFLTSTQMHLPKPLLSFVSRLADRPVGWRSGLLQLEAFRKWNPLVSQNPG
jgi:hypothetical protein